MLLPEIFPAATPLSGQSSVEFNAPLPKYNCMLKAPFTQPCQPKLAQEIPAGLEARQYHQARRSIFALTILRRSAFRHSIRKNPRHEVPALARQTARTAPNQGRGDRSGEQDRAHGVGHDGKRHELQGTRRTRPVGLRDVERDRAGNGVK